MTVALQANYQDSHLYFMMAIPRFGKPQTIMKHASLPVYVNCVSRRTRFKLVETDLHSIQECIEKGGRNERLCGMEGATDAGDL